MSAVSSITIVALPAPTPYAGLPELYAALTIAGPPVAIVRSQMLISSLRERDARTLDALQQILGGSGVFEGGAHDRTVSFVVFLLAGCGEKMTASLHLIA